MTAAEAAPPDAPEGEASKPPPASPLAVPVLLLMVFLSLIGFGVVIPLLPFYAVVFDASPWQVSLMFATFSAGQFLGELVWGRLSDRIGRRPVLLITILLQALGYLALAFAPSIWIAVAARGAAGFFGGNMSTIQGYMVDISPPERLAGRLGLIGAAFGVGFVVGPSLGGLLAVPELGAAGFRPPLLVAFGLCLLAALGVLTVVKESRRPDGAGVRQPGPLAALGSAIADPVLRRLLASTFFSFCAFSAMWSTVGLWLQARFGWGPREIGGAMALTGLAAALSQGVLAGAAVRRFGEVAVIVGGLGLCSLALLSQSVVPAAWMATACLTVAVVGHASAQPGAMALISRAAPAARQGATLGANNAVAALARVSGPVAGGVLFQVFTAEAPIVFAAVCVWPAAWLAWRAGAKAAAPSL